MPSPAFIVEGHLEQRMIQIACPGNKVVLLGVNGDDVLMGTIATRIETHLNLFSNRYYPVIVIFDRERRQQSVSELVVELQGSLCKRGIDVKQLYFLISDRDIETMFVAHVDLAGEFIVGGCPDTPSVDGINGEFELRKRLA
jgi:hypothetical protein